MERILNLSEAASLLRVTRQTLADEIRNGKFPGQKVGREFRILESAVMKFLQGESAGRVELDNTAIVGVETLSTVEGFLFNAEAPTQHVVVEFDRFCDAVAFHDQVIVVVNDEDVRDLPIIDAFSGFVQRKSLPQLRAMLDGSEFRRVIEDRIERTIGGINFILVDQIASKGINVQAPRIVQDLFLQIILNSSPQDITADTQKLFRKKMNAPPPECHTPDLNYFLRAFLYDAFASLRGWSYIPNFARSVLFSVLGVLPHRTDAFRFMSDVSTAMAELVNVREQKLARRWVSPRSSAAYVALNRVQSAAAIYQSLLKLREELADVRKTFSDLLETIRMPGDVAAISTAITTQLAEIENMKAHFDLKDGTAAEKAIARMIASFFGTLSVSPNLAAFSGSKLPVTGRLEIGKEIKHALDHFRFAPLVNFYGEVAKCEDFAEILERLYGIRELPEDRTATMMYEVNRKLSRIESKGR